MRLLNKSIIVTGAGGGIGEGIALRLALPCDNADFSFFISNPGHNHAAAQ